MQNFDVDAKPVGDAEHVDDAKLVHNAEPADDSKPVKTAPTFTVKPFYGFELVYKADGEDEIKAKRFADENLELAQGDDGEVIKFTPFDVTQYAFVRWVLACTKLRKPKYQTDRGSDIVGLKTLKDLRNAETMRCQAGVQGGRKTKFGSGVTKHHIKKLQLSSRPASVDVIELAVGGATVRVLPRQLKDGENLYVCDEDMAPCMAFIKEQGLMPEHEKCLPASVNDG